ncbi:MAG: DUF971 domain-containing protein [Planctomycetota bacterium]
MSEIFPESLSKTDQRELVIQWSDGMEQVLPFRLIRDNCPCATCMEKKLNPREKPAGSLHILSAAEARPLELITMRPVGNYAYNISFSDGHTSGIFSFDLLRSFG